MVEGGFLIADVFDLYHLGAMLSLRRPIAINEAWVNGPSDPGLRERTILALSELSDADDPIDQRLQVATAGDDPLVAAGGSGILLVSFIAVGLLVIVAFLVSVIFTAHERMLEMAVLRTLGIGRRTLLGQLIVEYTIVAVVGLGLGTFLGDRIARLMLRFLEVDEAGDRVLPPFLLTTDWTTVGASYLVLIAMLAVGVAIAWRLYIREVDHPLPAARGLMAARPTRRWHAAAAPAGSAQAGSAQAGSRGVWIRAGLRLGEEPLGEAFGVVDGAARLGQQHAGQRDDLSPSSSETSSAIAEPGSIGWAASTARRNSRSESSVKRSIVRPPAQSSVIVSRSAVTTRPTSTCRPRNPSGCPKGLRPPRGTITPTPTPLSFGAGGATSGASTTIAGGRCALFATTSVPTNQPAIPTPTRTMSQTTRPCQPRRFMACPPPAPPPHPGAATIAARQDQRMHVVIDAAQDDPVAGRHAVRRDRGEALNHRAGPHPDPHEVLPHPDGDDLTIDVADRAGDVRARRVVLQGRTREDAIGGGVGLVRDLPAQQQRRDEYQDGQSRQQHPERPHDADPCDHARMLHVSLAAPRSCSPPPTPVDRTSAPGGCGRLSLSGCRLRAGSR